jgi:tetratricopeptide (TPR) repeat protein
MANKKSVLLGLLFVVFAVPVMLSQTVEDAKKLFNRGAAYLQQDELDSAIAYFEKTVNVSNIVGMDADMVRIQAETRIPGLYYKKAMNLYKEKKLDEALEAFIKTGEVAKKYNDTKNRKRVEKIVPQLYAIKGNQHYKAEEYDQALDNYEKAIEIDSGLAKAYLGKGLVYKKTDKEEAFEQAMRKAIEKGEASEDEKTVENAKKVAGNHFLNKGINAKNAAEYQNAYTNLKKSVSFNDESEQAYYLLAMISNEIKKWDDAIDAANKAIGLVGGNSEEISKANFQLGRAYEGKGNKEAACKAYKNVTNGPYVKSAQYQRKHGLKCN